MRAELVRQQEERRWWSIGLPLDSFAKPEIVSSEAPLELLQNINAESIPLSFHSRKMIF
jgi:hypothetical protein